MSSSGHGQSIIRKEEDIDRSWHYAQEGGRAGAGKVIVEGFVDFDYEITQLTVRHIGGTSFLEPVGHVQVDGDYRESWQPQAMNPVAKEKAREIAGKITEALGGRGIFGVELFVKGEDVIFSEVSPRPHDTGMVTIDHAGSFAVRFACPCYIRPTDPEHSFSRCRRFACCCGRRGQQPTFIRQPG